MTFDAIIFDMDGVLFDSEKYWPQSDILFLSELLPNFDKAKMPRFLGVGSHHVYKSIKEIFSLALSEDEFVQLRMEAARRNIYPQVELMPGFLEFLHVAKKNHQIALGTSTPQSLVDFVFARFGLNEHFDAIATIDDANGKGKPNPDIFLAAADKLKIQPERCLVIEDADAGVEAGKRAGMTVYGFRNGINDDQSLVQADMIFRDYSEIIL